MTDIRVAGATAISPVHRDRLFIDGAWVAPLGLGRIDVVGAATEEVIGSVPEGTPDDADRAVAAAARALPPWSATSVDERSDALQRLGAGLGNRTGEIARTIAAE